MSKSQNLHLTSGFLKILLRSKLRKESIISTKQSLNARAPPAPEPKAENPESHGRPPPSPESKVEKPESQCHTQVHPPLTYTIHSINTSPAPEPEAEKPEIQESHPHLH